MHKVRRLTGSGRGGLFRPGDREDLEQELLLHWVSRAPRHDPARASARTFADRVVASGVADLVRHARAAKRDRRRERPLDAGDVPERALEDLRERARLAERLDLRLDVLAALAGLPDEVRCVAGLLMVFSEADAARQAGLSRQRVRTIRGRIEECLRARGLP